MRKRSNVAPSTLRWRKWYAKHGDPTRKQRREKWEISLGKKKVRQKEREYMRKYRKTHPNA